MIDGFIRNLNEDEVESLAGWRTVIDPHMKVREWRAVTFWLFDQGIETRCWLYSDEQVECIQNILLDLFSHKLPVTVSWLTSRNEMLKGVFPVKEKENKQ